MTVPNITASGLQALYNITVSGRRLQVAAELYSCIQGCIANSTYGADCIDSCMVEEEVRAVAVNEAAAALMIFNASNSSNASIACVNYTVGSNNDTYLEALCGGEPEDAYDSADVLCGGAEQTTAFVLTNTNITNPAEHCDMPFVPDLCVKEGGVLYYSVQLSEEPATNIDMLVFSDAIQANVTVRFTLADWMRPHPVTLFANENLVFNGNHFLLLHHQFHIVNASAPTPVDMSEDRVPGRRWAPNGSRSLGGVGTAVTSRLHGKFFSVQSESYRPLSIPLLVRENDKYRVDPVIGEYGRQWRLTSRVEPAKPAWRGPFNVGPSFFDEEAEGFFTHAPPLGLPDIAFRLHGGLDDLVIGETQDQIYIFRPCYVEPPNLPPTFYADNQIECPASAPRGFEKEEGEDPLCLWSNALQIESNPPSIYVGYNDPCFIEYPVERAAEVGVDLYAFVSTTNAATFIRIDMEKGKRLNAALQAKNVDRAGAQMSTALGCGALTGFFVSLLPLLCCPCFCAPRWCRTSCRPLSSALKAHSDSQGGDPMMMIKNVQEMATSGQVNVALNPGMRGAHPDPAAGALIAAPSAAPDARARTHTWR